MRVDGVHADEWLPIVSTAPRDATRINDNRLRDGTPEAVITNRVNVSRDTVKQHYEKRTERENMQTRCELFEDLNGVR